MFNLALSLIFSGSKSQDAKLLLLRKIALQVLGSVPGDKYATAGELVIKSID